MTHGNRTASIDLLHMHGAADMPLDLISLSQTPARGGKSDSKRKNNCSNYSTYLAYHPLMHSARSTPYANIIKSHGCHPSQAPDMYEHNASSYGLAPDVNCILGHCLSRILK